MKTRCRKKIIFNVIIFFAAIFFIFACIEMVLRGWYVYYSIKNTPVISTRDSIRILAVGESTTAPNVIAQKDNSWPVYLAQILNAKVSRKIEVYNVGRPGTNTHYILEEIEKNLNAFNPHIVISLMGINDGNYFLSSRQKGIWGHIKALRLFDWIVSSLATKTASVEQETWEKYKEQFSAETQKIYGRVQKDLSQIFLDSGNNIAAALNQYLSRATEMSSRHRWIVYNLIAENIFRYGIAKKFSSENNLNEIYRFGYQCLEKTFSIIPEQYLIHPLIMFAHLLDANENMRGCQKLSELLKRNTLTQDHIARLHLIKCDNIDLANIYKQYNIQIEASGMAPIQMTIQNYHALAEILKNRGVKYICMQYPTAKINELRAFFSAEAQSLEGNFHGNLYHDVADVQIKKEFQDIYFVENANFSPLRKDETDNRYFTDRFAGKFGHTTDIGSKKIAENVSSVVLKIINDLSLE